MEFLASRARIGGAWMEFKSTVAAESSASPRRSRCSPGRLARVPSCEALGLAKCCSAKKMPKPPKDVPQLADIIPAGLTERQLIERHSSDQACVKCHARIDPFGFALESYDAIGRRRQQDAAGLAIDSNTTLPDGAQIEGLAGLRDYLLEKRRDEFLRQFCRKLLGYAIGRELQLSDRPLVDEMMVRLAENEYRASVAVETIVLSKQFRMIRGVSSGDE